MASTPYENPTDAAARTRWGAYITEAETRALGVALNIAGEPGRAIDVGAGAGRWSKFLASRGWSMVCTDIDERALAVCQERVPDATCIVVDEETSTLPGEAGSVQLVLCMEVMAVYSQEWFLGEAARVLEPGGLLVGMFMNLASLRGAIKHTIAPWRARVDPWHYDPYTSTVWSWRDRLQTAGLELIHTEGLCWFPFRRNSNSPLVPVGIAVEQSFGLSRAVSLSPWIVHVAQLEGGDSGRSGAQVGGAGLPA